MVGYWTSNVDKIEGKIGYWTSNVDKIEGDGRLLD